MTTNRIIGYTLLTIGLLFIIIPLWQTYGIFTGKITPPQVFHQTQATVNPNASAFDIQTQVQNALLKILPLGAIDNVLNLFSWLVLIWVFMYGGGKIANIGINLIKI